MTETRSGHSYLGVASFVLPFFPVVLVVSMFMLVPYVCSLDEPGASPSVR